MLATPGPIPSGPEWVYEVKWDGLRMLADVADGELRLRLRSGRDVTAIFPELAGLTAVGPDVLLDGEIVLLDDGVPSFAALAELLHRPSTRRRTPVTFMVFDVLRLYGVPLLERPLHERRATLERLDTSAVETLALSPLYTDGQALFEATRRRGMEGIVAKRRDEPYREGEHSWVTTTHRHTQTCLVGGWRPERSGSAALLLGVPDGGELAYVGRVAAGPAQRILSELLPDLERPGRPFAERPPRAEAAGVRWCEPVVAVEVAHAGWTAGGRLRQPTLRGVRADVEPQDVRREG
jgi:bifunctional non-homologous end joining protein LigD